MLSDPVGRRPSHTRDVQYRVFARDDGLLDIEAVIQDTKPYAFEDRERGPIAPGGFVHDIAARVTAGRDLIVVSVEADLRATPHRYCVGAAAGISRLEGASLMKGWRRLLAEVLGGVCGCAHLRELLVGVPTAALQAIAGETEHRMRTAGERDRDQRDRPYYLGGCYTWDAASPVTRRYFPQFADVDPPGNPPYGTALGNSEFANTDPASDAGTLRRATGVTRPGLTSKE